MAFLLVPTFAPTEMVSPAPGLSRRPHPGGGVGARHGQLQGDGGRPVRYERLLGNTHFAIDPAEAGLPSIVDLDLAPRNAAGLVEFSATVDIVKPAALAKGRRRVLYEFSRAVSRPAG